MVSRGNTDFGWTMHSHRAGRSATTTRRWVSPRAAPGNRSNVISGNGAGNSIAYNGTIGIFVFGTADHGNTIRGNQIFSNNFLGIDLGGGTNIGFGATANDPDDSDGGPNNMQNFPVLTNTVV